MTYDAAAFGRVSLAPRSVLLLDQKQKANENMNRSFFSGIGLAIALCAALACGRSTPSEAFSASSKDLIVLDMTGLYKCPDYVTLAGKSLPFACGQSTSTFVDKGSAGKSLTFSGKWRILCPRGEWAYSTPYTYTIILEGEGWFGPTGPWIRMPCPEDPYNYTGANVSSHNTPYGTGLHYNIKLSD